MRRLEKLLCTTEMKFSEEISNLKKELTEERDKRMELEREVNRLKAHQL